MMLHALSLHLPFKDAPGFDRSGKCACVRARVRVQVCAGVRVCMCACVSACVCKCACMFVCESECACVCANESFYANMLVHVLSLQYLCLSIHRRIGNAQSRMPHHCPCTPCPLHSGAPPPGDMVTELRCATDDPFRDLVKVS